MTVLTLGFTLNFNELYDPAGLARLDSIFLEYLHNTDAGLCARLRAGRADAAALSRQDESALLIALAPYVEDFLAALFGIRTEIESLARAHHELAPLYGCKRNFIQRRVAKAFTAETAVHLDGAALAARLSGWMDGNANDELTFARHVNAWSASAEHGEKVTVAEQYAAWALYTPAGRAQHAAGVLFQVPHKLDPLHLVPVESQPLATFAVDDDVRGATETPRTISAYALPDSHLRPREGFGLTDPGTDLKGALDAAHYCIGCHHQGKDSCSSGLKERTTGAWARSPFNIPLAGCPLDEKISEMHELKVQGHAVGALAMIVVDNPLCAATGHRICNDCMKSCIYQKQEPVDIPQAETRILKDVLDLPYGFEIYSLLTRWNPLDLRHPHARTESGYKVLVVGLGPAGFGLAHQLLNAGHRVVGVDGLKIEPLPADLSGVLPSGKRVPFHPVRDVRNLYDHLGDRVMAGFGGVAEYGITVRWNKNFLKIIRLLLERRRAMTMIGGVRMGGTLTLDDAFAMGFDHVALCMGAGKPHIVPMVNGLARGVRQASDFLMALQLTGAAKTSSIANLTLRLPVVVIGGGLTAIDTATEALAYYPVQVEKFLTRYDILVAEHGEEVVRARWTPEEALIAEEFLTHARAIQAEREVALREQRPARILNLLHGWGGATIAYRRRLIDAPSYTLNHEEIYLGMREGIRLVENATPQEVIGDRFGHAAALRLSVTMADGGAETITLPARAILVAAGTQPNTVLAREHPGSVQLDGRWFQAVDMQGRPVAPERLCKPEQTHVLTHRRRDGRAVSFFGDLHPSFAGNVVKALGGVKRGAPIVDRVLRQIPPTEIAPDEIAHIANHEFRATIHQVNRLTPNIVEVVVKAPRAARNFQPGQFYRLHHFETLAYRSKDTVLASEGMALTGAWVDAEKGKLAVIVLEMGGSTDLCATFKVGDPVTLMGPTGAPTAIPANQTVCLVGGGLGNAVLFSIGQACRAQGSRVLYFAGYKRVVDRYKLEQIEAAADRIVWCCDEAPGFPPSRPGDMSFVGNIVEAMRAYAAGELGATDLPMTAVDHLIVIGSDRMMAAVAQARHTVLKPWLKPSHHGVGSINAPMQCMMKEICAQCLQRHINPATGAEEIVFSCFNQDQSLDAVDFISLNQRLAQNGVHEKLTAQWIDRTLRKLEMREG